MIEEIIAVNIFYTMTMANVLVQIKLHDMVQQYALLLAVAVLHRHYGQLESLHQWSLIITKTRLCNIHVLQYFTDVKT